MSRGTPVEKRKEEEKELVVRLTPEICYIDLAFPRRCGSGWKPFRFPVRGSLIDVASISARLKPDNGKASSEFSAYPISSCCYPLWKCTRLNSCYNCVQNSFDWNNFISLHRILYIDKQIEFTLRYFLLNFSYVVWWRKSTALLLYAVQIYRRISLEISR